MKIIKAIKEVQKTVDKVAKVPWDVWTAFWEEQPGFNITEDQVSFDGDYKSLGEMREAITWFVTQFGGEVKWKD